VLLDGDDNLTLEVSGLGEVVEVVSRRGILPILAGLATRPMRHNELARYTGLENKQLSRALRCAEDAGLVNRRVRGNGRPVEVAYCLTERGASLVMALNSLAHAWERGQGSGVVSYA